MVTLKDFHDTSWCMALQRLHQEMIEENEFMEDVSHYHLLTEDDITEWGKQLEADEQGKLAGSICEGNRK